MRRHVEDFNERVIAARYRLPEGPPLVTMPRDVDETVAAWRERRTTRLAEQRRKARAAARPSRRGAEAPMVAAAAAPGTGETGPLSDRSYRRRHPRCYLPQHERVFQERQGLLPAAGRRGTPAAARDPRAAEPGHPLLRPEQREDGVEGPRPGREGRRAARQPRGRHQGGQQGRRPRGSREDRAGTPPTSEGRANRPSCGPGSTPSTARGDSTTSPRWSPRSATGSTWSWSRRCRAPRTSTTSTGCSPSSRPRPASTGRSSCTPSSRPPAASRTSRRSAAPARACRASPSARPTWPRTGG